MFTYLYIMFLYLFIFACFVASFFSASLQNGNTSVIFVSSFLKIH
nr:MAG TPA: hypothetical protein [Caudoviricetes sp.]